MRKLKLFNSFISTGSYSEFVKNIFELSEQKDSSYVCVCNVHMMVESIESVRFNNILNNADIVTPDGMPIVKLISWKYKINQERVAGMDLIKDLVRECSQRNKSIFFYGSTNDVLSSIKENLNSKYENLKFNLFSPPFRKITKKEELEIIDLINKSKSDFLFVSLGCPKQEKWMYMNKDKIKACMIGLGGAFDVYAKKKKRAPQWMINFSLEWLFRLILEPKRLWKRYFITNSKFIWYLCTNSNVKNK